MPYKFTEGYMGYPPIEAVVATPAALNALPIQPAFLAQAIDKVFGAGEFLFVRANGSIRQFGLVTILPVFDTTNLVYTMNATEVTNAANLAQTLGVAQVAMSAGQYGWVQLQGVTPVSAAASVAAGTSIGIGGAGQVGAVAAGKQILNAVSVAASAATVVKANCTGDNGSTQINVPNTDGLFVGMALSGTGVGAGTIQSIDPMGRYIISTAANTAAIAGSVTGTMTGFIMAEINRPFAQGAIT